MPAEPETRNSSWLVYATTFAVVFPVLYVLSSGPAQCIERSDTGKLTLGHLFVKRALRPLVNDDLSIPFRQGSFALCRWAPPIRRIYAPLEWLSGRSASIGILGWYWDVFRPPSHYEVHEVECETDPYVVDVFYGDEAGIDP